MMKSTFKAHAMLLALSFLAATPALAMEKPRLWERGFYMHLGSYTFLPDGETRLSILSVHKESGKMTVIIIPPSESGSNPTRYTTFDYVLGDIIQHCTGLPYIECTGLKFDSINPDGTIQFDSPE